MNETFATLISAATAICFLMVSGCCPGEKGQPGSASSAGKTVRVAQSGDADVVGTDNAALQKAADMLQPGDILEIAPGTYTMENSVFIPCSDVVVRGTPGETD